MNTHTFQLNCWRISLATTAAQVATLLEAFSKADPTLFTKVPRLKLAAQNWSEKTLSDHDFIHAAKTLVEPLIDQQLRSQVFTLISGVVEGKKALDLLKNAALKRPDKNYDRTELDLGKKSELEHSDNPEVIDIIVKDHLDENPHYYSELIKFDKAHNAS